MSEAKVNYACLRYLDDKIKYYYAPIQQIFAKRSDETHIMPKNFYDFDAKHKYHVLWKSTNTFYEAYIVCFGESESDAQSKAESKSKRHIIPKKLTSSESSDAACEKDDKYKLCNTVMLKKVVSKQNSERTIQKFKEQMLMNNRRKISLDDKDSENSSTNKDKNNDLMQAKVVLERVETAIKSSAKKDSLKNKEYKKGSNTRYDDSPLSISLPLRSSTPEDSPPKRANSVRTVKRHLYSPERKRRLPRSRSKSRNTNRRSSRSRSKSRDTKRRSHSSRSKSYSTIRRSQCSRSKSGYTYRRSSRSRSKSGDFNRRSRRSRSKSYDTKRRSQCSRSKSRYTYRRSSRSRSKSRDFNRRSESSSSKSYDTKRRSQRSRSKSRTMKSLLPRNSRLLFLPTSLPRCDPKSPPSGHASQLPMDPPKSRASRSPRMSPPGNLETRSPGTCRDSSAGRRASKSPLGRPGSQESRNSHVPLSGPPESRSSRSPRMSQPGNRETWSPGTCRDSFVGRRASKSPLGRPGSQESRNSHVPLSGSPESRSSCSSHMSPPGNRETRSRSRSRSQSRSRRRDSRSISTPRSRRSHDSRRHSRRAEDESREQSRSQSNGSPECPVPFLKAYKPKLYRMYFKKGYDLASNIPERYRRYKRIREDKLYLGLGIEVGEKTWRMARYKRRTGFLSDLDIILWGRRNLANRCLALTKVKNQIPNRSPVKLCTPRKLNLYLSLYEDYLKYHKSYSDISTKTRDLMIKNSTEHLSAHIRDERSNLIKSTTVEA